jgi:hypothetical protein
VISTTMAPPKSDNWIRRFAVSDPRRHKKGFTVYKVTSIVSTTVCCAYDRKLMYRTQTLYLTPHVTIVIYLR